MYRSIPCDDHLGNHFDSTLDMCKHWDINPRTYDSRRRKGYSLERALTEPSAHDKILDESKGFIKQHGCYIDHLGNPFCSTKSMCKCWSISTYTFYKRVNAGMCLKDCLTLRNKCTSPAKDVGVIWVFGVPYATYPEVDKAYGYCRGMAVMHRDNLEEWLSDSSCYAIDGKTFGSTAELAEAYNKTEGCIYNRVNIQGWSLEDAIHTPVKSCGRKVPCTDHLGNTYVSKLDMCKAHGMRYSTFMVRMSVGWSLEDALTKPVHRRKLNKVKLEV